MPHAVPLASMGAVMDVAVVGSGDLARTLAYRLTGAGYRVAVAGLDGQDVGGLAEATGAQAMPLEEAVESSDVVFVAIPFRRHCELPPEPFTGKIVVDATDYFPDRDGAIGELDDGETTSSELLARHLPTARVVKALNTLNFFALGEVGVLRDDVTPVAIPDRRRRSRREEHRRRPRGRPRLRAGRRWHVGRQLEDAAGHAGVRARGRRAQHPTRPRSRLTTNTTRCERSDTCPS
jgi:predicted dinucleotide-binding enzyme